MSQDKEREIQLQFLEEAIEYLDTIESVLLGLSGSHIDGQQMDAVLRAAHSVKGGAGMMGYGSLSQLAHRLEDSFKVMKAQRNSIQIDGSLESLLLSSVDRLRQVLILNRQGTDVDEQWLATVGNPVFEQLHEILGDPVADDAATMLGAEDGTNVAALLFETEVEGCLERLESVLADPQAPCLEEELLIMAQELGGLGEMLQLPAWTSLCESVIQHLETTPTQVKEIAKCALHEWRRSQALVLVSQTKNLPTLIHLPGVEISNDVKTRHISQYASSLTWDNDSAFSDFEEESHTVFDINSPLELPHVLSTDIKVENQDQNAIQEDFVAIPSFFGMDESKVPTDSPTPTEVVEEIWSFEDTTADIIPPDTSTLSPTLSSFTADEVIEKQVSVSHHKPILSVEVQTVKSVEAYGDTSRQTTDIKWREVKSDKTNSGNAPESQENSVRIPVRQLDRLNELFGELTIERNGLSLHLGRLRNLIETLNRRVGNLEQSNMRLRTAYDTVATQSADTFNVSSKLKDEAYKLLAPLGGRQDENIHTSSSTLHPLFDALEMDRYSDLHLLSMEVMETIVQIQEVTSDIGLNIEETDSTTRELNQTSKQLQTHLTRLRMRPLSDLVGKFSRALRDMSLQHGKLVELKVVGKGTLIDRSILEVLSDPLMHLVRNAFDHGLEDPATREQKGKPRQGTIEIKAAHRGNQTIITVSDDGKGIDLNKIRTKAEAMGLDAELLAAASENDLLSLIFEPGFSTAERVTDLSGRGVGMDVVRNNLTSIRGDIRVDTTLGQGTTFTLTVPFTLSIARVLLVESNSMLLAFPTDVIEEMLLLRPEQVIRAPGSEVLAFDGEMVPLTRLDAWLTFRCPRKITTPEGVPSISEPTVIMVSLGEQLHGLVVDRCWGEREVAIRQISGPLSMPPGFASCTIQGDGKVVPLVDTAALLRWVNCERSNDGVGNKLITQPLKEEIGDMRINPIGELNSNLGGESNSLPPYLPSSSFYSPQGQKDTILVVDDSINVRRFLALALEKAGYLVEQAKDGQDAVEKLLGGSLVSAVICDIEMPRLDGYGFLARIKSDPDFRRLPIAMLTSRSGEKHRQLAMTLGASAYFSKPYNERELLRTLKEMITESREILPLTSGV